MFMDFTPNNACKEIYHKIYARFITRFKAIGRLKIKLPRYFREIYHKIFARFITRFKAAGRLNKLLLKHLCGIYHKIYARFKSIVNRGLNYA